MNNMIKRILRIPGNISNRFTKDHVGTYASQASLFMLLSLFPLAMLVLTLVKYTSVTQAELQDLLLQIVPNYFKPTLIHLIKEVYKTANSAVISITAIGTVWAASKGIMAILVGLNEIYHHNQNKNWFFLRFMSIIYTVLFVFIFVLVLVVLVFGTTIATTVIDNFPKFGYYVVNVLSTTSIISFFILTIFFILVYAIVRSKVFGFLDNVPGALFASAGWIFFSYFFSIYIEKFAGFSAIYGSMTTIILVMLWVYALMYILFIGAEINVYCKKILLLSSIKRARKKKQKAKEKQIVDHLSTMKDEQRVDEIEEANRRLKSILKDGTEVVDISSLTNEDNIFKEIESNTNIDFNTDSNSITETNTNTDINTDKNTNINTNINTDINTDINTKINS